MIIKYKNEEIEVQKGITIKEALKKEKDELSKNRLIA